MNIGIKKRLISRLNTHSFYVLSTSFLRLFYVMGSMIYAFCILCILRA